MQIRIQRRRDVLRRYPSLFTHVNIISLAQPGFMGSGKRIYARHTWSSLTIVPCFIALTGLLLCHCLLHVCLTIMLYHVYIIFIQFRALSGDSIVLGWSVWISCATRTVCWLATLAWYCLIAMMMMMMMMCFDTADIDECLNDFGGCDVNARCVNTEASYKCLCQQGYHGDGFLCEGVWWRFVSTDKQHVGYQTEKKHYNYTRVKTEHINVRPHFSCTLYPFAWQASRWNA